MDLNLYFFVIVFFFVLLVFLDSDFSTVEILPYKVYRNLNFNQKRGNSSKGIETDRDVLPTN